MIVKRNIRERVSLSISELMRLKPKPGEYLVTSFEEIPNSFLSVFGDDSEFRVGLLIDTEAISMPDLLFSKLQFRTLTELELATEGKIVSIPVAVFISLPDSSVDDFIDVTIELVQACELGSSVTDFYELVRLWASVLGKQNAISESVALGLWGEIVVSLLFVDVDQAVRSWHVNSTDPWDFVIQENLPLEIKTTTQTQRIHSFSSHQIGSHTPASAVILSLQTVRTDVGTSVFDLMTQLKKSMSPKSNLEFQRKLSKICPINSPELKSIKWDLEMARSSLSFILAKKVDSPVFSDPIQSVKWSINLDRVEMGLPSKLFLTLRKFLLV